MKGHPYESDYAILEDAFKALLKENENNFKIIRNYKGALNKSSHKQLEYEKDRIEEVYNRFKTKYAEFLKIK